MRCAACVVYRRSAHTVCSVRRARAKRIGERGARGGVVTERTRVSRGSTSKSFHNPHNNPPPKSNQSKNGALGEGAKMKNGSKV